MDLEFDHSETASVSELMQCTVYGMDVENKALATAKPIALHPFGSQQGTPGPDGYNYPLTLLSGAAATIAHDLVVDVKDDGSLLLTGMLGVPGRRANLAFDADATDAAEYDAIMEGMGAPVPATGNANSYHTFGAVPGYRLVLTASDLKQVMNFDLHQSTLVSYRTGDLAEAADTEDYSDVGFARTLVREIDSAAMHHRPIPYSRETDLIRSDYPGVVPDHDPALTDAQLLASARVVEILYVSADTRVKGDLVNERPRGSLTAHGNVSADVDVFWVATQATGTSPIGLAMSPDWTLEFELRAVDAVNDATPPVVQALPAAGIAVGGFEGSVAVYEHGGSMLESTHSMNTKNHKKLTVGGFECGQRYYVMVETDKPGDYHLEWKVSANK